jgi:hypothetical protein
VAFQFEQIASDGKQLGAAKTLVCYGATNFTAATSEAMITLTPVRDGVNQSTGTSFIVTSGKRLVLLALAVSTKNAGAAMQGVQLRLRYNPSGAVTTSSPVIGIIGCGTEAATANVVGANQLNFSVGSQALIEIVGDGTKQIGISQIGTATAGNDVVLIGYEY